MNMNPNPFRRFTAWHDRDYIRPVYPRRIVRVPKPDTLTLGDWAFAMAMLVTVVTAAIVAMLIL